MSFQYVGSQIEFHLLFKLFPLGGKWPNPAYQFSLLRRTVGSTWFRRKPIDRQTIGRQIIKNMRLIKCGVGATTLSIATFSITALSITTFSKMTLSVMGSYAQLSSIKCYAECRVFYCYTEFHYTKYSPSTDFLSTPTTHRHAENRQLIDVKWSTMTTHRHLNFSA
jgi:hypothetical protein